MAIKFLCQYMQGPNNSDSPYMEVRIEAFEVFDSAEQTSAHIPRIFQHLVSNTSLKEDQIHVICYPLPLWRIGKNGHALKGIPGPQK